MYKTRKSTKKWLSNFGIMEEMDLSCIHLAVCSFYLQNWEPYFDKTLQEKRQNLSKKWPKWAHILVRIVIIWLRAHMTTFWSKIRSCMFTWVKVSLFKSCMLFWFMKALNSNSCYKSHESQQNQNMVYKLRHLIVS